jgi:pimeloyl-ACP methyl ester carboxylesterase
MPERVRGIAIVESFGWPVGRENPNLARILRVTDGRSNQLLAEIERAHRAVLGDRPLALVFGAESYLRTQGFPERWKARFPDADLLIVDGAHHFPMADDPDLVARALAGWWREEVQAA